MDNKTIAAINKAFHAKRHAREELVAARREEVYTAVPRIRAIDDAIWSGGFHMLSAMRDGQSAPDAVAAQFSADVARLQSEKAQLLRTAGYSIDYLEPPYACPRCKDTGCVDGELCACYLSHMSDALYEASNLGVLLREQTFEKFDLHYYANTPFENRAHTPRENMVSILGVCKDFVQSFDTTDDSLILYGNPGLGKTFLSSCIANALLRDGKSVFYQSAGQIFDMLGDVRFGRGDVEGARVLSEKLFSADLLIIDDLGTEFINAMSEAELFRIVNGRILAKQSTIINTNLKLPEISKLYSDRILSRILGHYTPLHFYGVDIRSMKS